MRSSPAAAAAVARARAACCTHVRDCTRQRERERERGERPCSCVLFAIHTTRRIYTPKNQPAPPTVAGIRLINIGVDSRPYGFRDEKLAEF